MEFATLLVLALGVSMDAFAVAVCKGIAKGKVVLVYAATIAVWFGAFHALMPGLGYLLGSTASGFLSGIDHFILFFVMLALGLNAIREARKGDEEGVSASTAFGTMFILSLALSLDSLAVGISVALKSDILSIVAAIGTGTALMSFLGVVIGAKFGNVIGNKANYVGGVILIFIGTMALLEGLGVVDLF